MGWGMGVGLPFEVPFTLDPRVGSSLEGKAMPAVSKDQRDDQEAPLPHFRSCGKYPGYMSSLPPPRFGTQFPPTTRVEILSVPLSQPDTHL